MYRNSPDRPSSPAIRKSLRRFGSSCLVEASKHKATGKSNALPSLRKSAGAKLTVIRVRGSENPPFERLECTRSSDSLTVASGRPTNTTRGSPRSPLFASTATGKADTPSKVAEFVKESIFQILRPLLLIRFEISRKLG